MPLDAVILGFYERDFATLARGLKSFSETSGAYHELSTNSLLIDGKRRSYIDILNRIGNEAAGRPINLNPFEQPNLGVAYLASFLAARGHSVEIVNFVNTGLQRLEQLLKSCPRTVVITTTYYVTEEPITEIVKFIRSIDNDVRIIIGGPRIFSVCSAYGSPRRRDAALRAMGGDLYICDSQGEETLARVLEAVRNGKRIADLVHIPNLFIPDEQDFVQTERVVEQNDMNANRVQWALFNDEFVAPTVYLRTARSCPFACRFCDYPSSAGKHTVSEADRVVEEIEHLVRRGVRNVIFIDDTFNVPLPRFKHILREIIRRELNIRWVSFFRCSNADAEAFDLMQKSGCLGVYLGIESGDDDILKRMNKYTTLEKYEKGVVELHARGILTLASMIVGYPGETEESVNNSIDFLSRSPLDFFSVQLYYHNPMAPIERFREEYGIEGSHYSWKHSTMDWREALAQKERVIKQVVGSSLLPLYDLSIWAFPFLLHSGFTVNTLRRFLGRSHQILIEGLGDDASGDGARHIPELVTEFGTALRPAVPDNGRILDSSATTA